MAAKLKKLKALHSEVDEAIVRCSSGDNPIESLKLLESCKLKLMKETDNVNKLRCQAEITDPDKVLFGPKTCTDILSTCSYYITLMERLIVSIDRLRPAAVSLSSKAEEREIILKEEEALREKAQLLAKAKARDEAAAEARRLAEEELTCRKLKEAKDAEEAERRIAIAADIEREAELERRFIREPIDAGSCALTIELALELEEANERQKDHLKASLNLLMGSSRDSEIMRQAFRSVLMYIRQIIRDPTCVETRRIRRSNQHFSDHVGQLTGGIEVMEAVGFELQVMKGEEWLILNKVSLDNLSVARNILESHMERCRGGA